MSFALTSPERNILRHYAAFKEIDYVGIHEEPDTSLAQSLLQRGYLRQSLNWCPPFYIITAAGNAALHDNVIVINPINGVKKTITYRTTGGDVIAVVQEITGRIPSPSLAGVVDLSKPITWRWENERFTKLILGFVMAMNPAITDMTYINQLVVDLLVTAMNKGNVDFRDRRSYSIREAGLVFIYYTGGGNDGFPLTVSVIPDMRDLLIEDSEEHQSEYKKAFIRCFKDTELTNPEPPLFPIIPKQ